MLEVVEELAVETVKAASAQLWPLSDSHVSSSLRAVHRWEQCVALLKSRLVGEIAARGIPSAEGHRSTTAWLRERLRLDPFPARELAAQADALRRRPAVEQAVLDGLLDMRQAMVIATALNAIPTTLDSLDDAPDPHAGPPDPPGPPGDPLGGAPGDPFGGAPGDPFGGAPGDPFGGAPGDPADGSPGGPADGSCTDPAMGVPAGAADPAGVGSGGPAGTGSAGVPDTERIVHDAEAMLIDRAGQFPAYQLRQLGDRILAHVAPEIADRADEAALRRQEKRAHAKRSFTLGLPIDGMVRLSGVLDTEAAAIVAAALQPLCAPTPGDDRTPAQRRADALVDICRLALRSGELPDHGGEPPQVPVTLHYDTLTRQLGGAVLDNGERVSAATARRMACDARLTPIVLGGAGQVLDAGRSRRLAHGPLRRALVARDRGCAHPGCDRPPRFCDAHHLHAWSRGGVTNLDNLVLLCRRHHHLLHDPASGWHVRLGADRLPEFIPPPWIDLLQRPQRNLYHPRT